MFTNLGFVGSSDVIGLTVNLFALARYNFRAQSFFRLLLLFTILYLPIFP